MIFLDANIFLRPLTRSPGLRIQRMNEITVDLLRAAERGDTDVITSDAVIADEQAGLRNSPLADWLPSLWGTIVYRPYAAPLHH